MNLSANMLIKPKPIEIHEVFARYATNVIASVAFGFDIDCFRNPDCKFRKYGKRVFDSNFINAFRNTCTIHCITVVEAISCTSC